MSNNRSAPPLPIPPSPHPPLPLGPGVAVLAHHPDGLIALDKPSGILTHPNDRPDETARSLLAAPYDTAAECYLLPDDRRAYLLHRLDSATSGVVLIATDAALAAAIKDAFLGRAVEKTYLALVFGLPRHRKEVWQDHLQITRVAGKLRTVSAREGELAVSDMRHLQTVTGTPILSLLELRPRTGRTHQLRVQCQKRRLPIAGDATYGDFAKNRAFAKATGHQRLFLHAQRIALTLTYKGTPLRFAAVSPVPEIFRKPR